LADDKTEENVAAKDGSMGKNARGHQNSGDITNNPWRSFRRGKWRKRERIAGAKKVLMGVGGYVREGDATICRGDKGEDPEWNSVPSETDEVISESAILGKDGAQGTFFKQARETNPIREKGQSPPAEANKVNGMDSTRTLRGRQGSSRTKQISKEGGKKVPAGCTPVTEQGTPTSTALLKSRC